MDVQTLQEKIAERARYQAKKEADRAIEAIPVQGWLDKVKIEGRINGQWTTVEFGVTEVLKGLKSAINDVLVTQHTKRIQDQLLEAADTFRQVTDQQQPDLSEEELPF
jgi:hypothetical protein